MPHRKYAGPPVELSFGYLCWFLGDDSAIFIHTKLTDKYCGYKATRPNSCTLMSVVCIAIASIASTLFSTRLLVLY